LGVTDSYKEGKSLGLRTRGNHWGAGWSGEEICNKKNSPQRGEKNNIETLRGCLQGEESLKRELIGKKSWGEGISGETLKKGKKSNRPNPFKGGFLEATWIKGSIVKKREKNNPKCPGGGHSEEQTKGGGVYGQVSS